MARATTTLAEARQASAPWKRRRVPRLQAALEEAGRAHDTASLRLRQGVDARRLAGERAEIAAGALAKLTGLDALGTLTIQALDLDRRRLEEEREGVDSALMQLPEHVAQNCLITATTVAGASTGRHDVNGYDVVVVDEAGMVDRASAFVVTGLARRAVVLAGDFRQLPAVVSAVGLKSIPVEKQRLAAEWMAKDVFLASGVVNSAGLVTADPRLVTLSEQYRMRRAICDLVNDVAYRDAPLVTGRGEVSAVSDCSLLAGPVVLIDSSGSQVSGRGPTRNIAHAAIIRELIRGLQYADVLPPRRNEDSDPPSSVGIVCPYNQQKTLLNRVVLERFGERYQLADTVHRFQGSQRPVIVLDTVAGAADSLGQFWDKVGLTSTTCRLLNVAMSRAQDHLVIVANVDFLEEKLPAGSEVRRMLTWLQERAARLSVDTLVPTRSAAALATLDPTQLARPAFFPADEVAAAVTFDIDHATTRVDLFCPFIRPRTVHDVLPHLRRAVDRGVRVRAMVRPFEPGGIEANACDELRGAGCEVVDHREVAHEKVLIVDDILWHGSFNLLAHYRSTELMMRMVDTESIAEVVQILDRARPTSNARPDTRAQATVAGPDEVAHRCYLRVPYREKDDAKALGARWDTARRQWYFDTRSHEGHTFSRWMS